MQHELLQLRRRQRKWLPPHKLLRWGCHQGLCSRCWGATTLKRRQSACASSYAARVRIWGPASLLWRRSWLKRGRCRLRLRLCLRLALRRQQQPLLHLEPHQLQVLHPTLRLLKQSQLLTCLVPWG